MANPLEIVYSKVNATGQGFDEKTLVPVPSTFVVVNACGELVCTGSVEQSILASGSYWNITSSNAISASWAPGGLTVLVTSSNQNYYVPFIVDTGSNVIYIDTSSIYYNPELDLLSVPFISASFINGTASFALSASWAPFTPTDISTYLSSSWTGSNLSQLAGTASMSKTASIVKAATSTIALSPFDDPVFVVGGNSTKIGPYAGYTTVVTTSGVFIGDSAAFSAKDVPMAVIVGGYAGQNATSASSAVIVGYAAGAGATSASQATIVGYAAGQTATDARNATYIGAFAGRYAPTGSSAIFVGFEADASASNVNVTNSIAIGYKAKVTDSNQTVLGNPFTVATNIFGVVSASVITASAILVGTILPGGSTIGTPDHYFDTVYATNLHGTADTASVAPDYTTLVEFNDYINANGNTSTYLVDGGQLIWKNDYNYDVTTATYYINGTRYVAPFTSIQLSGSNPLDDRIDVIAVDIAQNIVVLQGSASSEPAKPAVDPDTQLELTFIYVQANTAAPTGSSAMSLYQEGNGYPNEWSASTLNPSFINLRSTFSPYSGSYSIEETSVVPTYSFQLYTGSAVEVNPSGSLTFYIKSKGAWGTQKNIRIQWYSGSTFISRGIGVQFRSGNYGFTSSYTAAYQPIVIPISAFMIPSGQTVNRLEFMNFGTGTAVGYFIDSIAVQAGTPTILSNGMTQAQADARYLIKTSNLSDVTNVSASRANLKLGTAATRNVGSGSTEIASGNHNHALVPSASYAVSASWAPVPLTASYATTALTASHLTDTGSGKRHIMMSHHTVGAKNVVIEPFFSQSFSVVLQPSQSAYVELTVHGWIPTAGAINFKGEYLVQYDGTDKQPGVILSEYNNNSGSILVTSQLFDPGTTTGSRVFPIRLKNNIATTFPALLTYEVKGLFSDIDGTFPFGSIDASSGSLILSGDSFSAYDNQNPIAERMNMGSGFSNLWTIVPGYTGIQAQDLFGYQQGTFDGTANLGFSAGYGFSGSWVIG